MIPAPTAPRMPMAENIEPNRLSRMAAFLDSSYLTRRVRYRLRTGVSSPSHESSSSSARRDRRVVNQFFSQDRNCEGSPCLLSTSLLGFPGLINEPSSVGIGWVTFQY